MESKDWANYIESTDGLSKPWLLIQWRLQLLQDQRPHLEPETYATELADLHSALMNLGEWWHGQEQTVFSAEESPLGEP
ncbi:MAG: hypothetical protein EA368_11775 [Leptolyngbya sp. DLM2.Bin27]|nr:MAG: hypothetical protein EA368_11775 [Leptolyngbya sp. DLM2.Bin27]